jgi:hypothetical protein
MSQPTQEQQRLEIDNRYYLPRPADATWFGQALTAMFVHLGPDPRVNGEVRSLEDSIRYNQRAESRDAWLKSIEDNWGKIESVTCWLYRTDETARGLSSTHLRYAFEREELNLSAEGSAREELRDAMRSIERSLGLAVPEAAGASASFIGASGMYFTKHPLDPDWFKHALQIVRAYSPGSVEHFDGRIKLIATPNLSFSKPDLDTWEQEIITKWDATAEAYLWVSLRVVRVNLRCDLRRHRVDLTVEARTQQKLDEFYQDVVTKLGLEAIAGRPYKVQSSGTFEVEVWRNEHFAAAVGTALRHFVGARPAVNEAVIVMGGDTKDVAHYDKDPDLNKFLERLKSDEPYTEIGLSTDGPRGAFLSVYATNIDVEEKERKKGRRRTLVLKTSVSIKEFPRLAEIFSAQLQLRKLSVVASDGRPAANAETSTLRTYGVPVLTAVAGLVLSSAFWAAAFRQDKLRISVPPPPTGQATEVTLNTTRFPVEWVLDKTQWFHTETDRQAPALVRVLKDGITEVKRIENASPGAAVDVGTDGTYDIEVVGLQTSVSDKVRVKIQTRETP